MKKLLLTLFSALVLTSAWAQKNKVYFETEYGKVVMELYDNTPKHRDNMLKLAKEKFSWFISASTR